jgi:hypothetical protein
MPQTVVVTGMSMALRNEYTERAKRVLLAQARPRDLPFLSATVGYLYLCCGFFFLARQRVARFRMSKGSGRRAASRLFKL